jgi:RNA polymerase sigma factor (sigma-70 family)
MLVNEFVSWQRRRARTMPHPEVSRLAEARANRSGATIADPGDTQTERAALLDELSRLPARQRAAIVLRYYADLSDADIAATLCCRVGTVRSSISRGLATLRVTRISSADRTTP